MAYIKKSHIIEVSNTQKLHVIELWREAPPKNTNVDTLGAAKPPPLFFLHGAMGNHGIFCSQKFKGLAPFLADYGFRIFMAEHRGRGKSTPLAEHNDFSQHSLITEDIPAFSDFIAMATGQDKQIWVAHSWGGVLMASALARFPRLLSRPSSLIYLGSKRRITAKNIPRLINVDVMWNTLGLWYSRKKGYLPASVFGYPTNESYGYHRDVVHWIGKNSLWRDPTDDFDYGRALSRVALPPMLFLAGEKDLYLGNPKDVKIFMDECGLGEKKIIILGQKNGFKHDYDHINMLTHKDASIDHFPLIKDFICN